MQALTNDLGPVYIIDGVGKDTFTKDLAAVASCGHVTIFGAASSVADAVGPNSLQQRSISIHGGSLSNQLNGREELLMRASSLLDGIIKAGWLKLNIGLVLPLKDAARAHELMETRSCTPERP